MEFSTIGAALRSRRQSLGIDQTRAAVIVGMSRTSYSSYERDHQRPSVEVLPGLAEFLDISIDDVLNLYGGTCIEAIRPSLERFLATRNLNESTQSGDQGVVPTDQVAADVTAAPRVSTDPHDGSADATEERSERSSQVESKSEAERASASIFDNELSHGNPRFTAPTGASDHGDRLSKKTKDRNGKKKKKKGKKS